MAWDVRYRRLRSGEDVHRAPCAPPDGRRRLRIRRFLLEHKLASWSGGGKMPAIMGTNIYDLGFADVQGLDYTDLGYAACTAASAKPVAQGNVGSGIGATVGPFFGSSGGTKGGLGSCAARAGPWTGGAA